MRNYNSLRKKNSGIMAAVVSLSLCVVLSGALLMSRLMAYSYVEQVQRIPLTKSNGLTHVTSSAIQTTGIPQYPKMLAAMPVNLFNPGFETHDENTVWSGETNVEIFSIRYDNESGETTVHSQNSMKVLAPGVGDTYTFELENTGNTSLDYTMEMDAWFSNTQYPIPVFVRVTDSVGNRYLGTETEMVDVLRLSEVSAGGTIAKGYVRGYTLEWEWPFELDDTYDTMLGNMAVDEDLVLTIQIRTTAVANTNPNAPGGDRPATGDTSEVALYAILMVISLAGILVILLNCRKEETNEAP